MTMAERMNDALLAMRAADGTSHFWCAWLAMALLVEQARRAR
jgi:hypothetical protein